MPGIGTIIGTGIFATIDTVAEEVKNPKRDLPIGILIL
jgi:amino acid transporter